MSLGTELWIRIIVSALLLVFPLSLLIQKIITYWKKKRKTIKKVRQVTATKAGHTTKDLEIDNGKKKYQVEAMIITKQEVAPPISKTITVDIIQQEPVKKDVSPTIVNKPEKINSVEKTIQASPVEPKKEISTDAVVSDIVNKKLNTIKEEAKRLEERNPNDYEKKLIEGLSLSPDDTELLTMLTDYYFQADEHKKALSLLKKLLDQQKDNHKALRQMGEIYLKQGDIQTAEIMIEKAVKKSSDNPKYLYSLVDIKYNTDNLEDAIYLVERILKLRPTNVEYLTAAAMLYEKQGDKLNAKKRYFEVLQYDPENRVAKKKLSQYK